MEPSPLKKEMNDSGALSINVDGNLFQISWKDHSDFMDTSIAAKEMLPIAVVAAIGARNGGVVQQNLTATMKPWFIHSWQVPAS